MQIISAPSILGLKPTGVEKLPESLLSNGLFESLGCQKSIVNVPTQNSTYSLNRDKNSCLNTEGIRLFSGDLAKELSPVLKQKDFALVLGGDCSILIGICSALKANGTYGLLFYDAHADFYQPEKSVTGELADMDLAIVTGRGPDILTDINHLKPYVADDHVIHIGQRDWEETKKYGSQDIRETAVRCFDYEAIKKAGIQPSLKAIEQQINTLNVDGFWIHFDTDVLSDNENPAVDYRLPGGFTFDEGEQILKGLLSTNKIVGMSVTIFNPKLDDEQGSIAKKLTRLLSRCLKNLCYPVPYLLCLCG